MRLEELDALTAAPELWNDAARAQKLLSEKKSLEESVTALKQTETSLNELSELCELAEEEGNRELVAEIITQLEELKVKTRRGELEALLSGEADKNDAFLEVHAGSGGTEAQDWAEMLLRMYTRWAEAHQYKVEYVEEAEGDVAGLKSATVKISGHNAYGWLKSETGVHRLGRIFPFDRKDISATRAAIPVLPRSAFIPTLTTKSALRSTSPTAGSIPTARRAPAASTSTRPIPRSVSPIFRPES